MVTEPACSSEIGPKADTGLASSVAHVRSTQCPQLADACYLDAAAAPPFPSGLVTAVAQSLSGKLLSNPHSKSPSAISTADQISATRLRIMRDMFGIQDTHDWSLIFTSGTTASLKLVGESFDWTQTKGKRGFSYLVESHTSAVGIRDLAALCDVTSASFTAESSANVNHEGLVVLPLQCNATGKRYVDLAKRLRRSTSDRTLVMVDAASYLSSSQRLNLSLWSANEVPDLIAFSFYKIFGYPTGLGGLLVRRSAAPWLLHKTYHGGGTVDSILAESRWTKPRKDLEARLEDGTSNIHGILAVNTALDYYEKAFGLWDLRGDYVGGLSSRLVQAMEGLRHGNGNPVVRIYRGRGQIEAEFGPIVNFNVLAADGTIVPPQEVDRLASISNIHLRTGRHCNPGFVTSQLGVTEAHLKQEYADGVGCDDAGDAALEGSSKASASLRASLCLLNAIEDVERLVGFIARFFLSCSPSTRADPLDRTEAPVERRFDLANITVYPIKSCSGQNLERGERWRLTRHGLEYDREWIVMNLANGKALSQKRFPKMVLIRPRIDLVGRTMSISIAGIDQPFTLDLDDESQYAGQEATESRTVQVCGVETRPRAHKSEQLRILLSNLLGVSCTLAKQAIDTSRHSKLGSGSEKVPLIFSNESPFLLINSASIDEVCEWMQQDTAEAGYTSVGTEEVASDSGYSSGPHPERRDKRSGLLAQAASFRANFLVSPCDGGPEAPFAEDMFSRVTLGDKHVFAVLGECRRCQMVCVDQCTGEVKPQTLKTLAKHRRNGRGRIIFGSHLAWLPGLELRSSGRFDLDDARVWVGMSVVTS
ncbi:molybdenum cofactor sulfurase [Pseudozyma hubeiensis SY62]|uniref:Molybdenum cofactor sulfurase n=1 Tax=Pseudozyma hubeiensis (strain SY62) TaxID=1305764 RepID=R9NYF0_PSEHS|nr:molybdenum cofactor sulfurase [Pseudozyma hubeiensis SY62]GAC93652.1 molybdenum cofactor sulfurase [Pseudozyma hubeiensis SY62]